MTKYPESANQNIVMNTGQEVVTEGNKIQIDVRMEQDTLWLTLLQMAQFELLQKLQQFKREQQASQVGSLVSLAQGGADS